MFIPFLSSAQEEEQSSFLEKNSTKNHFRKR
jgi:hypothetical protein